MSKRINLWIALPGYILGAMFTIFCSYKTILIGWVFAHLFLLTTVFVWKTKRSWLILLLAVAVNVCCLFHIGSKDNSGPVKRIQSIHRAFRDANWKNSFDSIPRKEKREEQNTGLEKTTEPSEEHKEPPKAQESLPTQPRAAASSPLGASPKKEPSPDDRVLAAIRTLPQDRVLTLRETKNLPIRLATTPDYGKMSQQFFMDYPEPRLMLYLVAFRQILSHPYWGCGSTNLVVRIADELVSYDVHSNVISAFLMTGVFGGTLYLICILRGFVDSWIVLRRYPDYGWLAMVFMVSFVSNLFAYGFPEVWVWLPLAALRACVRSQGGETPESKTVSATEG